MKNDVDRSTRRSIDHTQSPEAQAMHQRRRLSEDHYDDEEEEDHLYEPGPESTTKHSNYFQDWLSTYQSGTIKEMAHNPTQNRDDPQLHLQLQGSTSDRDFQQGNRKLAMVGDTIMRSILIDVWERREETVPSLDRRIRAVTKNSYFKKVAIRKQIDALVLKFFPGDVLSGKHVFATTVKALVGAVWYDSKKDRAVLRRLLDHLLSTNLEEENRK